MEATPAVGALPTRPTDVFARDRFTWVAYLLLGYFAYLQSLLGPIMPFLREELGMTYVQGSLHVSASAIGMVAIGLIGDKLIRRTGFRLALWGGAIGMGIGAIGLTLGHHIALTIAATAGMGILGTVLLISQQAAISHHHGPRRAIAFTEANVVASLCSMLAPVAVGAAISNGVTWRIAVLLPIPLLAAMLLREWRQPVPEPARERTARKTQQRLPLAFWAYWAVACLSVAAEWSIGFWGADYLHTVVGFSLEFAVTSMSVFFLAMLIGRFIGSRLTRRILPIQLLTTVLLIALAGILIFWLAPHGIITIVGLGIAGLGVGNLFPFSLAVATDTAPEQTATASARMTLAGGLAILIAPLALGSRADQVGLSDAFAMVPAILVVALAIALGAGWAASRSHRTKN